MMVRAGSIGEAFVANPLGPRVVALEVRRGYRDAPSEERQLVLSRHVSCKACSGAGCERCSLAGWTVADTMVKVIVPHGTAPGARLSLASFESLEGATDEDRRFLRSIEIEMVEPGPRAGELAAAEADFVDKLVTAWRMDCDARLHGRRRRRLLAFVAAVALLAVAGGWHWLTKATAGEPCASDSDCSSGRCMRLLTQSPTSNEPRVDGLMCSSRCETDLDCPRAMHCAITDELSAGDDPLAEDLRHPQKRQYVTHAPSGHGCIPNGY